MGSTESPPVIGRDARDRNCPLALTRNQIEMKLNPRNSIRSSMLLLIGALSHLTLISVTLAAAEADVIQSVRSGSWTSPETWSSGKIPGDGAKVLVQRAHTVLYDHDSSEVIRGIQIAGALKFATDRNTRLEVGLIRIENINEYSEDGFDCSHATADSGSGANALRYRSALQIGLPDAPLPAQFKAIIRLHHLEGMNPETCPAIVCCGGRMDLHGAPLERTWIKLPYQTAKVGEARVVLPYPLPGWKEGDRIVISGTTRQFGYLGTRYQKDGKDNGVYDNPTSEERVITRMRRWGDFDSNLQIVSFDKPLEFDHLAAGEYRAEVANLSRNIVIESADPSGVRGHTMYHADSAGSISYAEFRHLGKKGVLGKYPIHYHLVGQSMRGSSLIGLSVWDSHNRWITVHGTQYLVIKDCVGYKSLGHGYFLEDGTEVCNIFDRNLAIQALRGEPLPQQVLPYDNNLGSGFWWANSLNTFTRNVAAECDEDGFRYEVVKRDDFDPVLSILQPDGSFQQVDVRTLPFIRFDGNEAHCHRLFGVNLGGFASRNFSKRPSHEQDVNGVGPDYKHPFLLRNTKVWNSHWAFHIGSPNVQLQNADIHDCAYGLWRCVMNNHEYLRMNFSQVNTTVFFPRGVAGDAESYTEGAYSGLKPQDDRPPVTVVTGVTRVSPEMIKVSGVTTDNYTVKTVTVNDQPVRSLGQNFNEWEILLPVSSDKPIRVVAGAEDAEGNREQLPHILELPGKSGQYSEGSEVTNAAVGRN